MARPRVSTFTMFLIIFVLFSFCVPGMHAFGAGNIPSFAFMEGKAFRHGDIEDVLEELVKKGAGAGGGFALGSLLTGGPKFGGLDIKRVYFGNWLRDYSQAVDIAGLKKLPLQSIINLCMVLGFLAHGYATSEFEVTTERLGVYLPTEHIDNPRGYGDGEDARKYHPNLRPPVDPRELEVDPRTGMKNYIANENGTWDTSKALVRRTLEKCIHLGRKYRSQGLKADKYESYRLLGQALHTLEDFPAHSNFCELTLLSMGHQQVFTHIGDYVRIQAPNGRSVPPLVTGTFGGNDFLHSLLGEATDHISQASVSDLNKELDKARSRSRSGGDSSSILRDAFGSLPGSVGGDMSRDMDNMDRIRAGPAAGGKKAEDMTPQELHAVLWQVLSFRDSVMKRIEMTIEKIPGLRGLIDKVSDNIAVFVYTTLEPYLKPLLLNASNALAASSAEVINSHDQYEVFNDPRASDPTHSFLSKDHFNLILNEPAGQVARIIVTHAVKLVVKAWDDPSVNTYSVTEDILSCLFHPEFHNSQSQVQREMLQYMHAWVQDMGKDQKKVLERLTKDAVRNHRNVRGKGDSHGSSHVGGAGYTAGVDAQHKIQGYMQEIPGVSHATTLMGQLGLGGTGPKKDVETTTYSSQAVYNSGGASYYGSSTTTTAYGAAPEPPAFPEMFNAYAPPPVPSTFSEDGYDDGHKKHKHDKPDKKDKKEKKDKKDKRHDKHHDYDDREAPPFPSTEDSTQGVPAFPAADIGDSYGYAAPPNASEYAPGYAPGYMPVPGREVSPYGEAGFAPPPGAPPGFPSADAPPSFPGAETQYPPPQGYPPPPGQPGGYQYGGGMPGSGW